MEEFTIRPIASIRSDFTDKFGIPRQAGIVEELEAEIVFEPEYRNADAFRGLEGFSHIWVIWQFSGAVGKNRSLTVRPPRLGGNTRMGVFATRSPFRPNSIGLSCVRLKEIRMTENEGPVLRIAGADMMDGTPVFDVKPYVPYADSRPDALSGFAPDPGDMLQVVFMPGEKEKVPPGKLAALEGVLANDPRPRYQDDAERVYAMDFAGLNVKFRASEDTVTVISVERIRKSPKN